MLDFSFSNKETNIPFLFRQFQVLTGNTNYFHLIVFISQVVPKLGVVFDQKKTEPICLLASVFKF
jgi:hypothetical protein